MFTLPFLYLPDAITLIFLLVLLPLVRKIAIDHIRQELFFMRKEMLSFWLYNALDPADRGFRAMSNWMESAALFAPKFSPGRLVFLYRLRRKLGNEAAPQLFPDLSREVSLLIESTANAKGREKLKRIQLEMNLALGMFFLFGSLSGWFLAMSIVPRMIRRTFIHHQGHRIDAFFDMVERVLGSLGRQVQQLGYAGQNLRIE